MSNIQVKFYEKREDFPYRFSVICAWHQGELLLVRHRARDTWEIPGGHIEPGETPVVAARRELCEETGAQAFAVIPVCAYSVSRDGGEESFGMLYCGEVRALGDLPESEIVEVRHFPALPEVEALTYPEIQPLLYEKALMQRQPIPALEPMADFFTARVEGYDEHMLEDVEGCREGYREMAACIPAETRRLLDLGCGTGLELDEIFPLFPDLPVTGVDLTGAMLDCLAAKHPGRDLTLYCGDYFTVPFEPEAYDTAVSFQTMHHFAHEEKRRLYKKIHDAIKPGGVYIECDYMARDQDQEDRLFAENARIRSALGIAPGAFYHFDTPCTVENQTAILKSAGFGEVEELWRSGFTVMLRAVRKK